MIDQSMKSNRLIGIIQPKKTGALKKPDLYDIGCVGKITSFNETDDGRYLIVLNGVCRFKINSEITSSKLFRECNVEYNEFIEDLKIANNNIEISDLKKIFDNLKNLLKKQGYTINWNEIEKQNLDETINTLAMASPFSLEEKQALLETKNLLLRKDKLEKILITYISDDFSNTTIQ